MLLLRQFDYKPLQFLGKKHECKGKWKHIESLYITKEKGRTTKIDQVNDATAFWKRNKNELKKKDYNEFYKS